MKLHLNLVAEIEVIRYKNILNSKIVVLTNFCRKTLKFMFIRFNWMRLKIANVKNNCFG